MGYEVVERSTHLINLAIRREAGEITPEGAVWLAGAEQQAARDIEKLDLAESFNTCLGWVYCTSGFGVLSPDGFILDWGLIQLDPSRILDAKSLSSVCPPSLSHCPVYT